MRQQTITILWICDFCDDAFAETPQGETPEVGVVFPEDFDEKSLDACPDCVTRLIECLEKLRIDHNIKSCGQFESRHIFLNDELPMELLKG